MEDEIRASHEVEESGRSPLETARAAKFFNAKYVITNVVVAILALASAFFEYVIYPNIMAGFGESDIKLKLSFLTYQYSGLRCFDNGQCPILVQPPALDFFQIFLVALIVYNALKVFSYYRGKHP